MFIWFLLTYTLLSIKIIDIFWIQILISKIFHFKLNFYQKIVILTGFSVCQDLSRSKIDTQLKNICQFMKNLKKKKIKDYFILIKLCAFFLKYNYNQMPSLLLLMYQIYSLFIG
ncbi:transmembrane protein, putative (macronuclear) [Tetrahymena thermophila SB210]|uniref:Transmembrane protein, putative n=1 Tax=Tetrahymena thermophila (strain SB210) TaxID=312017 RepID=W7X024_TETTS|nr:transmembrane protein, putative [Tetrahymena thermophila SB210]EWS72455.1 transmembrane protein, putative [Tetrahymena thermophila SB210]|eukprot:XP_012655000.1 transmembrane protein, putative [Tetrahymena thermophila SB210]